MSWPRCSRVKQNMTRNVRRSTLTLGYATVKTKLFTLETMFNTLKMELEQMEITTSVASHLKTHSELMAAAIRDLNEKIDLHKVLRRLETNVGELRNTDTIIAAVNRSIEGATTDDELKRQLDEYLAATATATTPTPVTPTMLENEDTVVNKIRTLFLTRSTPTLVRAEEKEILLGQ